MGECGLKVKLRSEAGPKIKAKTKVKLRPRVKDRMSGLCKLCFLWFAFYLGFPHPPAPHGQAGGKGMEEPRMFDCANERHVYHCPYATATWHWVERLSHELNGTSKSVESQNF